MAEPQAGTPPPATGTGTPPPAEKPWYGDFQDPSVKEWLGSFNGAYPNAESVALKAQNLEKFIGAEKAGRAFVLPKDDGKPEEWAPIWKALGRPEKPEEYKVDGELAKDPMVEKLRTVAHGMGMPQKFLSGILGWFSGEMKAQQDAQIAKFEQAAGQEMEALRSEWGANYDANTELARRAASMFIPHAGADGNPDKDKLQEVINKMEGALGTKFTMNFFASVGRGLTEHGFVQGDQPGGSVTPEGARVRISALKKDTAFAAKLLAKDADAMAEWTKLHRIGYPEQQQPG